MMRSKALNLLLALSLAFAGACGGDKKEAHDHDHEGGEEHSHDDGDHADEKDDHEHGQVKNALGEQAADGWTVSATQMDEVKAGGETVFYLNIKGGASFSAGRIWVGDETASKSVKSLLEHIENDRYHAHVEIPDPLGETDRFWVEIDNAGGAPSKAGFEIKR